MFLRLISIIVVYLVICKASPVRQEENFVTDVPKVKNTAIVTVNETTSGYSALDRIRIFSDMLGIRNYSCKKYFICRVGQFFAAKMSLKERLWRFSLEFPLASLSLLENEEGLHKSEMIETLVTAISGFNRNGCSDELFQLCRVYHDRRSNFTDTATGRFIRHLLLSQEMANKLDYELMAQAQEEISNGFWNLINSYMITRPQEEMQYLPVH